jgi:hypothetical protein
VIERLISAGAYGIWLWLGAMLFACGVVAVARWWHRRR